MQGRILLQSTIRFLCALLLTTTLVACQGYESIQDFQDPNSPVADQEEVLEPVYIPVEDGYQLVTPMTYSGTGG